MRYATPPCIGSWVVHGFCNDQVFRGEPMTRRHPSTRIASIAAFVVALAGYGHASSADCPAELAGAQRIESKSYVLFYRTEPPTIRISEHFAVDLVLCAKDTGRPPVTVRVDATMPEHRHGMNYRTSVTPRGAHQYRAEGLLFHMPGRWEFSFDVQSAGSVERISHSVIVR